GNKHFKFNSVEEATKTIHDFILFFNHERITLKMADSVQQQNQPLILII
ncbi:IS3 family transposase, partial [Staphylococcus aureus]